MKSNLVMVVALFGLLLVQVITFKVMERRLVDVVTQRVMANLNNPVGPPVQATQSVPANPNQPSLPPIQSNQPWVKSWEDLRR